MKYEIERKYLIKPAKLPEFEGGTHVVQGYLCLDLERTVRVRVNGGSGYITIKGKSIGITRTEFEYAIPEDEALFLLNNLCIAPLIEKTRHTIVFDDLVWEIDEFAGDNKGLVLAEVELETADRTINLPDWIWKEVSDDPRFYNSYLTQHPYSLWQETEEFC